MKKIIFNITQNGIKSQSVDEQMFLIFDAKDFLQTLFENLMEEKITSIGIDTINLVKSSIELLKEQYAINENNEHDMINIFLKMNKEDIKNNPNLMKGYTKSVALSNLTSSRFFSKEEQRIICLAYFNDVNLYCSIDNIKDINSLKALEKQSLLFKKKIKTFLKNIEKRHQETTTELNQEFPKNELPVFDALLDDLVYELSLEASVKKAYKSCQSIIPFKKNQQKSKLAKFFITKTSKNTTTFNNK